MTFYELYNELSRLYPNDLKCEWDNDGIMCAYDLNAPVKKVLVALDVTMETVNYALQNSYDTIVSHHPLVFKSQKSLSPLNFTQNKLIKLIQNRINVMSFHTRLDAAQNGVNDTLASCLGLQNVTVDPLDPIGRIGALSCEMALKDFGELVKEKLSSPIVICAGNRSVSKVYVVGGDGKDLIENAIQNGADTLLTGRASYNTVIDAKDMGINIVEAGHFFTENPVCNAVKSQILEICNGIECDVFTSFKNIEII